MTSAINNAPATTPSAAEAEKWPLRFKRHNFGVACYSTYGCRIRYDGQLIDRDDSELGISSESLGADYPGNLSAGRLGIQNFPPPADVTWRSKDGTQLHAEIDMAAIFKEELILHNVPKNDVEKHALKGISDPGIILEVNDRTINVYMKAFVPTNSYRTPGNEHSNYRDDLILAYTRTY